MNSTSQHHVSNLQHQPLTIQNEVLDIQNLVMNIQNHVLDIQNLVLDIQNLDVEIQDLASCEAELRLRQLHGGGEDDRDDLRQAHQGETSKHHERTKLGLDVSLILWERPHLTIDD
jgi:hypothetical protein